MNKTKIVCTIGPQSLVAETLLELYNEGMSVARLNGSHADLDWHRTAISIIHKVLPNIPILLDIPGRKIRTGLLQNEPEFCLGDTIILTTDSEYIGDDKVSVNYPSLHLDLSVGNTIMADDGMLKFTVLKIVERDIYCTANIAGKLKSRKGINVPFVKLNTPEVTERDKIMIEFARDNKVDYIGLSFVESAEHVAKFKQLIGASGPRIVAKVENQGGMDNMIEIAQIADVIMIDRGDLSVETSLFDVALRQKQIINSSKRFGTPVIVATEMLHSMISSPHPTKSELTDISNAVLDGCSCTMLSGETAIGKFAVESVSTMRKVIAATESYQQGLAAIKYGSEVVESIPEGITNVIPTLCRALPITKVVAITRSGYAAKKLSKFALDQEILAVSDDRMAAKSFGIISGVTGVFSEISFSKTGSEHFSKIIEMLLKKRFLKCNDLILITGVVYPQHGSRMNAINIIAVNDLIKLFNWPY